MDEDSFSILNKARQMFSFALDGKCKESESESNPNLIAMESIEMVGPSVEMVQKSPTRTDESPTEPVVSSVSLMCHQPNCDYENSFDCSDFLSLNSQIHMDFGTPFQDTSFFSKVYGVQHSAEIDDCYGKIVSGAEGKIPSPQKDFDSAEIFNGVTTSPEYIPEFISGELDYNFNFCSAVCDTRDDTGAVDPAEMGICSGYFAVGFDEMWKSSVGEEVFADVVAALDAGDPAGPGDFFDQGGFHAGELGIRADGDSGDAQEMQENVGIGDFFCAGAEISLAQEAVEFEPMGGGVCVEETGNCTLDCAAVDTGDDCDEAIVLLESRLRLLRKELTEESLPSEHETFSNPGVFSNPGPFLNLASLPSNIARNLSYSCWLPAVRIEKEHYRCPDEVCARQVDGDETQRKIEILECRDFLARNELIKNAVERGVLIEEMVGRHAHTVCAHTIKLSDFYAELRDHLPLLRDYSDRKFQHFRGLARISTLLDLDRYYYSVSLSDIMDRAVSIFQEATDRTNTLDQRPFLQTTHLQENPRKKRRISQSARHDVRKKNGRFSSASFTSAE